MTDRYPALSLIDDYLSGRMSDEEGDRFEQRLFEPDDALEREVTFLDRLALFTHHIAVLGTLHPALTRAEVDMLLAAGRRVDVRELGEPGTVTLKPLEAGAEVVVQRADLRLFDVESVDLEVVLPELGHVKTLRDLKVDPNDGAVYACCDATLFRTELLEAGQRTIFRVVAMRDGRRETLAHYELLAPG